MLPNPFPQKAGQAWAGQDGRVHLQKRLSRKYFPVAVLRLVNVVDSAAATSTNRPPTEAETEAPNEERWVGNISNITPER